MKLKSGFLKVSMMAGIQAAVPEAFRGQMVTKSPNGNQAGDRHITALTSTPELRVLFCDQAGVAAQTREEAQRIASRVFLEARINLRWLDGMKHCVTEANCVLRIQPCYSKIQSRLPDGTVAFAPAEGRHVSVFWDRLAEETAAGSHSEALLLGYIMVRISSLPIRRYWGRRSMLLQFAEGYALAPWIRKVEAEFTGRVFTVSTRATHRLEIDSFRLDAR